MSPLPPGSRIGILGGGQLGRMLAMAAAELGFDAHIYTPEADSPAARVAANAVVGSYEDVEGLTRFAAGVDAVTFEFENVPLEALATCAAQAPVRPGPRSLEFTQDRLIEKQFVRGLGLETAPFADVSAATDVTAALAALGTPAILKTRRLGYDGKGQVRIGAPGEAAAALSALGGAPAILEGFVSFERELSVFAGRAEDGSFAPFAVTENVHADGILRRSKAPAAVSAEIASEALEAAKRIANGLGHIGVLAVEFFLEADGRLRVNEIAPRVHNSGHWTQDAGAVSQFEQHIRAVAGWPLVPPTPPVKPVVMLNLIGDDATDWRALAAQPSARLHLYGKRAHRPGRKMGHLTLINLQADPS